jgi:glutamate-1-semialdehyde aminotransferase
MVYGISITKENQTCPVKTTTKTDGTLVFFTPFDVNVVRHHNGKEQSASRRMINKLVAKGVITKNEQDKTYQATIHNFFFYFVMGYHNSNDEQLMKKYFPDFHK